jgi:hypothetical protein
MYISPWVTKGFRQMKNNVSLRDKYLSEKERIQHEIGSLDQVLQTLGLSQRKACQLLLVDPSAWTRWNKSGAPPHIYQALRWLIQLKKVNPDATAPSDIAGRVDMIQSKTDLKIKELERSIEMLERTLALQATVTPQYASDNSHELIQNALAKQDKRHQEVVAGLQAKIQSLLKKPKKAKPRKKKIKPKAQKKPKKSAQRTRKKTSARKRRHK